MIKKDIYCNADYLRKQLKEKGARLNIKGAGDIKSVFEGNDYDCLMKSEEETTVLSEETINALERMGIIDYSRAAIYPMINPNYYHEGQELSEGDRITIDLICDMLTEQAMTTHYLRCMLVSKI